MEKFISQFLGGTDVPTYLAAFAFALIGAIIRLLLKARKRDKSVKFSWRFLIQDNLQQLVLGMLIAFVVFRFTNQFIGDSLNMFYALGVGLAFTEVAGWFEKFELKAKARP